MRTRLVRTLAAGSVAALASIGLVSALSSTSAPAQTESNGNVTTCAQIGLGSDTQVAGSGDENIGITAGDSSITVSILGSNVVIDAVVVKGGPNANIYEPGGEGTFSTPTNPSNGQPYGLSHYFVCYHIEEVATTEAPTTTAATTPSTPTTPGAQVSPSTVSGAKPAAAVAGAARFTG